MEIICIIRWLEIPLSRGTEIAPEKDLSVPLSHIHKLKSIPLLETHSFPQHSLPLPPTPVQEAPQPHPFLPSSCFNGGPSSEEVLDVQESEGGAKKIKNEGKRAFCQTLFTYHTFSQKYLVWCKKL